MTLFRVRFDLMQMIGACLDREVETPRARHPSLPQAQSLIVFLGAQGRMSQILKKQLGLLIESLLYR